MEKKIKISSTEEVLIFFFIFQIKKTKMSNRTYPLIKDEKMDLPQGNEKKPYGVKLQNV